MSLTEFESFLIEAGLVGEFSLFLGLMLLIGVTAFFPKASFGLSFWICLFSLGAAFYVSPLTPSSGSFQSFAFHPFTGYLKQFFCISAAVALFGYMEWRQARQQSTRNEPFMLLLLSVIGLSIMIQANGLWLLFLAAELFSICAFAFAKPVSSSDPILRSVIRILELVPWHRQ